MLDFGSDFTDAKRVSDAVGNLAVRDRIPDVSGVELGLPICAGHHSRGWSKLSCGNWSGVKVTSFDSFGRQFDFLGELDVFDLALKRAFDRLIGGVLQQRGDRKMRLALPANRLSKRPSG